MKYQLCQNTYHELRTLYTQSKPRIGFAEVTGSIIQCFILSKLVWTRNFFKRLKKMGGPPRILKPRLEVSKEDICQVESSPKRLQG